MFREDLPGIIHRLSQQWVKAKVEAPYLDKRTPTSRRRAFDVVSAPDLAYMSPGFSGIGLHMLRQQSLGSLSYGRARSVSGASVSSSARRSTRTPPTLPHTNPLAPDPSSSNPEEEVFDPTYGLRPEGLPTMSVFSSFSRLFTRSMGLGDLAEEPGEDESLAGEEEQGSFDVVDWEDSIPEYSPPPTIIEEPVTEYETLPAVGGGTITRPRTQLLSIQTPSPVHRILCASLFIGRILVSTRISLLPLLFTANRATIRDQSPGTISPPNPSHPALSHPPASKPNSPQAAASSTPHPPPSHP
ncbi:hypothetical protein BDR03DRAFT_1019975 [Suillus americanus]|nr:hypothetical protein BDR03DRAFT_1019975 [Suillus americanus]